MKHYDIATINKMRKLCRELSTPHDECYNRMEVYKQAEESLRTYMLASITLEELEKEWEEENERRWKRAESEQRYLELIQETGVLSK